MNERGRKQPVIVSLAFALGIGMVAMFTVGILITGIEWIQAVTGVGDYVGDNARAVWSVAVGALVTVIAFLNEHK